MNACGHVSLLPCVDLAVLIVQGSCLQEAERIEEFFDTARARVEWLASRQDVSERRFATHQVPWDKSVFKTTRHAGLHLGVIYMSRSAWVAPTLLFVFWSSTYASMQCQALQ